MASPLLSRATAWWAQKVFKAPGGQQCTQTASTAGLLVICNFLGTANGV